MICRATQQAQKLELLWGDGCLHQGVPTRDFTACQYLCQRKRPVGQLVANLLLVLTGWAAGHRQLLPLIQTTVAVQQVSLPPDRTGTTPAKFQLPRHPYWRGLEFARISVIEITARNAYILY